MVFVLGVRNQSEQEFIIKKSRVQKDCKECPYKEVCGELDKYVDCAYRQEENKK